MCSDLQCGDGLVRVHQVWHDGLQRPRPLAGGSRAGTGVRPELTQLLMVGLLAVVEDQQAAGTRVLQGERNGPEPGHNQNRTRTGCLGSAAENRFWFCCLKIKYEFFQPGKILID